MKHNNPKGQLAVLGIDLAKQSFQLHGVDASGQVVLKKTLSRSKLCAFAAQLPVCTIGIEACRGANHWVCVFTKYGHTVHMMAPRFVKPYVKSNKSDAADAEAICEAVQRPSRSLSDLTVRSEGPNVGAPGEAEMSQFLQSIEAKGLPRDTFLWSALGIVVLFNDIDREK